MEAVRLTVTIKGQDSKILLSQHVDVPVCKAAETAADLGKDLAGFYRQQVRKRKDEE